MAMNPLPPQAYTKETLSKAYQWVQTQPESIKELATNPDTLVSLFLKAKLNGEAALERPSIQNFKSELKSLSQMMGEFEMAPDLVALHNANAISSLPGTASTAPASTASESTEPVARKAMRSSQNPPAAVNRGLELDPRSWQTLQELRAEFNLSSESETLRLLIAIAAKRIRVL